MKHHLRFSFAAVFASLPLTFFAQGCGGGASIEDVCQLTCSCGQTCSESALQDCVNSGEETEKLAEENGCLEAFDEYRQCLYDNFECMGGGSQLPEECSALSAQVSACVSPSGS